MYNVVDMYCEFVISPIEKQTKRLRVLVANKSVLEKIFNINYKDKALEEMESILNDCYNRLSSIINDENKFNNEIKTN